MSFIMILFKSMLRLISLKKTVYIGVFELCSKSWLLVAVGVLVVNSNSTSDSQSLLFLFFIPLQNHSLTTYYYSIPYHHNKPADQANADL